jgi:hypothetical protein
MYEYVKLEKDKPSVGGIQGSNLTAVKNKDPSAHYLSFRMI